MARYFIYFIKYGKTFFKITIRIKWPLLYAEDCLIWESAICIII